MLSAVTAVLSNLVSNVPAVLVLKPFVAALPDQGRAWLVVAMASTLAGNFTVLGSIANLIVVEKAAQRGDRDRLLGLFPRRRAADADHPGDRHPVAGLVTRPHATVQPAGSFDPRHVGDAMMSRIKILDEALWPSVPKEVVEEAEQAAGAEPCWIVRQGNGHVVASEEGPGSPDVATGDITYIAEVGPRGT